MAKKLPPKLQVWVDARKRFHLSHAHVQMARELGMNPKKLGGMANHRQQPWKIPLPQYIEELYFKRFGKRRPDNVRSIEQMAAGKKRKHTQQKERHHLQRDTVHPEGNVPPSAVLPNSDELADEIPF